MQRYSQKQTAGLGVKYMSFEQFIWIEFKFWPGISLRVSNGGHLLRVTVSRRQVGVILGSK